MSESGGSMGGRLRNPGGTPGGATEFFIGAVLAIVGGYLVLNQVQVHTSNWRLWGMANGFGVALIPLLVGIGVLFWNGKSIFGWLLTVSGVGILFFGILANMDIYFQRTTLAYTLMMFGMLAAGLGLIVKGLRPHRAAAPPE